ncbi:DUF1648 domain-containing protein [Nesterenkonia halotolerans]|uniref:DUF1648 domain-containing protein n=1 Tax=Nesterenkonia halotolerans TaxID=225325 RepID=UPI003EE4C635
MSTAPTRRVRVGSCVFWVSALIYAAVLGWTALVGPDSMPAHFGISGDVTRWESKAWVLTVEIVTGLLLMGLARGCRWMIPRLGPEVLSLPSESGQRYWTTPERRPELNARLISDLELMLGTSFLLLSWLAAVLLGVAETAGDGAAGAALTLGVLGYILGLTVQIILMFTGGRYRPPPVGARS